MGSYTYRQLTDIRKPLDIGDEQLDLTARALSSGSVPKSTIPAGFTYFLQFIDHDLARDESGIVFDARPGPLPQLRNGRSPFFDLDSLYGCDVARSAECPVVRSDLTDGAKLRIGSTVAGSIAGGFPNDLPRDNGRAIIADSRNDENLAVAQIHVAFIRFHNELAARLGGGNIAFEKARELTIRHYQWIVREELLPMIVRGDVLAEANRGVRVFYPRDLTDGTMPLEFSVGAFRFGHSMIRNVYHWNRIFSGPLQQMARVDDLRTNTGNGRLGAERRNLTSDWIANWRLFFDIDGSRSAEKFNFAARIDGRIASALGNLGGEGAPTYERRRSLAALDLFRARALGLPSGQEVARRISDSAATEIRPTVYSPEQIADHYRLPEALEEGTPLWLYLLFEAEREECGGKLGVAGSRIVAETFCQLLGLSPFSDPASEFSDDPGFLGKDGKFGMADLISIADVADPLGS